MPVPSKFILVLGLFSGALIGQASPAPTPPMGWNSWDSYGTTVREDQVKANADVMARELAKHGWRYIVVDIQWYEPNAQGHEYQPGAKLTLDHYGRLLPAVNRFPSAADGTGFKHLADYVHSKGLKFGIHIMRGIPRQAVAENLPVKSSPYHAADVADKGNPCRWNPDMWGVDTSKPGGQAYYDSIADLYASWGVDFIKADDMGSHKFQPGEIQALSLAMRKTGRPMVLSISPGPAPLLESAFLEKYAHMWRISDDFWDNWDLLKKQFDYTRDWAVYVGKNDTWPDADMLPMGKLRVTAKEGGGEPSKFTADEQQTVMTLWSIFRSPLIFGGDLPSLDPATTVLVTNDEVLEVDQHSYGGHQALVEGTVRAWTAVASNKQDYYVAVFNLGEETTSVNLLWNRFFHVGSTADLRDLWKKSDLGRSTGIHVDLRAHASVLYRISDLK
jgi:hypothetical protein